MRKTGRIKTFFAAVIAVLTLAFPLGMFSGCGRDNKNTIVVWCEAVGSKATIMNQFVSYFNENNDLGLTMKFAQKESLSADLRQAETALSAPDLVSWPRWETVSKSNLLVDLSSRITADGINMNNYNAQVRSELELGSAVYGIPTDIDAWGLWCNNEMFEDAGVTSFPSTWSELLSATSALTSGTKGNANRIVGLDTYGLRGQFPTFMYTSNRTLVTPRTGTYALVNLDVSNTTNESYTAAKDILDFFNSIYAVAEPTTTFSQLDSFIAGKVAMRFGPSNLNSLIEEQSGSKMDLTFVGSPAKDGGGVTSGILGGYGLAIPKTVNTDRSWSVMKWWLRKENLSKYCELYGLLPADTTLWNEDFVTNDATLSTIKSIVPTYLVRPIIKGYSNFETQVVFASMDDFREGNKTVSQTISNIKVKGDEVFELEFAI